MRIGVPAETTAGETRVAVTPETAKKSLPKGIKYIFNPVRAYLPASRILLM